MMAYEMRISDWSSDVCSSDLTLSSPAPVAMTSLPAPAPLASDWLLPVASASPPELIACPPPATRLAPSPAWMKSLPADATEHSARLSVSRLARCDQRRIRKESVRTVRSRWAPDPYKKKNQKPK